MKKILVSVILVFVFLLSFAALPNEVAHADSSKKYYTVYSDSAKSKILFLKGDDINVGDKYLSHENDLYEIESVDEGDKSAIAKFLKHEELPKFNLKKEANDEVASAKSRKRIGLYHTHNDECYFTPDGVDSIYGKGGIHDVGKALSKNFNKLGIETVYREDLHLPHNSGAYTRSGVTASAILNEGVDAIFDIHRDSTKRDYYLTKVDGKQMSSVRMVIGAASKNYEENKNFAYMIKGYADEVYPGLIKDIYIGKGNYNQQLSNRAMLFEMGCENIEKDLVIRSTEYLAKTVSGVIYGNELSKAADEGTVSEGVAEPTSEVSGESKGSNNTLWIILGVLGGIMLVFGLVMAFSSKARYKVSRFFSEMFAGIFGKKKSN